MHIQEPATAAGEPLMVVGLFTSRNCYSCPPVETCLGGLADDEHILALECHVDFWDRLNYGRHGRGKDVFSSSEMTKRQRAYNT